MYLDIFNNIAFGAWLNLYITCFAYQSGYLALEGDFFFEFLLTNLPNYCTSVKL